MVSNIVSIGKVFKVPT